MSTHGAAHPGMGDADATQRRGYMRRRALTETKPAVQTTEMIAFVAVLAGIFIAAAIDDSLGATRAWLYATLLTIGYMVSRGLAKAGSHEPRERDRDLS